MAAEVESILTGHTSVAEAAAVGVPDALKGEALICFAVLRPGHLPDPSLRAELIRRVIEELGKPLAPRDVHFVRDLPKTRNAKIMRRIIRSAFLNESAGDISARENPAALDDIRQAGLEHRGKGRAPTADH